MGPCFDPDDRASVREAEFAGEPSVAIEPIDLAQHRDGAGLDAAMAFVDIGCGFHLTLFSGLEGGFDIGQQGRLVAFDGEQIIGFNVADGSGDRGIACDGVDGDQGAFEAAAGGEFLEQQRDGGRFVGLSSTASCPRTRWLLVAKAETRCSAARPLERSWLPRTVLPSIAIVSREAGQQARTQSMKQAANRSGSIRFIMMLSQRPEAPQSNARKRCRKAR